MIEVIAGIGFPVARSVAGWLEKSLQDNKITKFELKKLVETMVRVGLLEIVAYFGLGAAGMDISMVAAGAGAFIADRLFGALKENKNVK